MRRRNGIMALGLAGLATVVAAQQQPASPAAPAAGERLPVRLVGDLHAAFGEHHARAVHSKGVILEGRFEPTPAAVTLSRALVFKAAAPVVVRFSDFTGIPDISDLNPNANPRGFAIRFVEPDDAGLDIVCHSFNGFPVESAADFSDFLRAIAASGPGASHPTAIERYLDTHPIAKAFVTTQKPPPASWATAEYFGVNAFGFTDNSGHTRYVRYQFIPESGTRFLSSAEQASRGGDYLASEIRERVAKGPIRLTWYAQLAGPEDRIDDPGIAWPDSRPRIKLGTVTLTRMAPETPEFDKALSFLPGSVPPGISLADPMLTIRNATYPISFSQRQ